MDEKISAQIVQLLKDSPNESMLGTKLAFQLKQRDLQPNRGLREFIDAQVPDVARLRTPRSGMDWVYALRSSPLVQNPNQSESIRVGLPDLPQDAWKTFVSPHSPFRLYAHSQTGELRVVGPGQPELSGPWKLIPACSTEQHLKVAEAWVRDLPESFKGPLSELPKLGTGPGSAFYAAVKGFALVAEWNRFRSRHLLEHFTQSLHDLDIPILRHDHRRPSHPSTELARGSNNAGPSNIPAIKELATAVIARMSDTDLRGLNLPLGHIIDVLNAR